MKRMSVVQSPMHGGEDSVRRCCGYPVVGLLLLFMAGPISSLSAVEPVFQLGHATIQRGSLPTEPRPKLRLYFDTGTATSDTPFQLQTSAVHGELEGQSNGLSGTPETIRFTAAGMTGIGSQLRLNGPVSASWINGNLAAADAEIMGSSMHFTFVTLNSGPLRVISPQAWIGWQSEGTTATMYARFATGVEAWIFPGKRP